MISPASISAPKEKSVGSLPIAELTEATLPLGGPDLFPGISTEAELWHLVATSGLTKAHFNALITFSGFSQRALASLLGISARTVQTKQLTDRFDVNISEKLVYLAVLFHVGLILYPQPITFLNWLSIPNRKTEGRKPADYLTTVYGIYKVIGVVWGNLDGMYE